MSKNLCGARNTQRRGSFLYERNKQMNNVESVKKAFHKAVRTGEQLLSKGKITWDEHETTMLGFEKILRDMGEDF